ncbi:unnamed protein product, partial [Ectocarpus sp. 12 AP-2014]
VHTCREGACGVVHGDGRSDTSVAGGRVPGKGSRPIESTTGAGPLAPGRRAPPTSSGEWLKKGSTDKRKKGSTDKRGQASAGDGGARPRNTQLRLEKDGGDVAGHQQRPAAAAVPDVR